MDQRNRPNPLPPRRTLQESFDGRCAARDIAHVSTNPLPQRRSLLGETRIAPSWFNKQQIGEDWRSAMSATGLGAFDKTLQTTHIWLNEIMDVIGPDRQAAWHLLGAVLRTLRNRVPVPLAVHLGAELPLLVRGTYYDQWRPISGVRLISRSDIARFTSSWSASPKNWTRSGPSIRTRRPEPCLTC